MKCCYRFKHDWYLSKRVFLLRKKSTKLHLKGFEVQHCVIFVMDFCLLTGKRIKDYFLWTLYRKGEIKCVMCAPLTVGRYCYLGAKGFEMWQVADASVVIVLQRTEFLGCISQNGPQGTCSLPKTISHTASVTLTAVTFNYNKGLLHF